MAIKPELGSKFLASSWPVRFLAIASAAILILMPFHALLSTWAGTSFGYYLWFKAWKEILLVAMAAVSVGLLVQDRRLAKTLFARKINVLIVAYCLIHVVTWLAFRPNLKAAVAGMMTNLRFVVFFGVMQIVHYYRPRDVSPAKLVRLVMLPALLVAGFALLQIAFLPTDFLRHFGYSKETIEPFLTIDQKPDLIRYSSTLRGPNPFGAYLIVPLAMLVYVFVVRRARRMLLVLVPFAVVLFYTRSRSAWIGAVVALAVLCALQFNKRQLKQAALAVIPLCIIGAGILFGLRDTYLVQNTLFHTDENSKSSRSSNHEHWLNSANGARDALDHPLGQGPGSAGPASVYNVKQTKIAENYYLQIAQEVGIVGLALFTAINSLLVTQLLPNRRQFWPAVLLASFAGITVINLFLHGWADDTIGLLWWGLAGAVAYATYQKAPKPKKAR